MRLLRLTSFLLIICMLQGAALAKEPFRVNSWLPLGEEVRISGESRARYETLDGRFRAGRAGSDQLLAFRTLVHGEVDIGAATVGVELQDSRGYLADDGTPLSSSFINAGDVLQAYVKTSVSGGIGEGAKTELKFGRQTIDIGSERQLERVDFANVIKSYTGLYAVSSNERGDELHALFTVLVDRRPGDLQSLLDNEIVADKEQWNRWVWGLHYRRADIAPGIASNLWGELFVYGLDEQDTDDDPTANRNYVTPGFRLFRAPVRAQWDLDVEGSWRWGARRATSNPLDREDLDTSAGQLLARFGYTFDHPWRPRVAAQYYYASGDENPTDGRYDQYERLFGGRRGDLNNTSIHGPLTPANLSAPGVRFDIRPNARTDARLHYSAAHLASDTDSFVIARLRDPSGNSGDFIGHAIDARARYWLIPDSVRLEYGASALFRGDFSKSVPGAPEGDKSLFAYSQVTVHF